MMTGDLQVFDDVLDPASHRLTWAFLNGPGWQFGAYSEARPDASRYWYKHFAGYDRSAAEERTPEGIAAELRERCPAFHRLWHGIVSVFIPGQQLGRCYANRMPQGVGGGLHRDSDD